MAKNGRGGAGGGFLGPTSGIGTVPGGRSWGGVAASRRLPPAAVGSEEPPFRTLMAPRRGGGGAPAPKTRAMPPRQVLLGVVQELSDVADRAAPGRGVGIRRRQGISPRFGRAGGKVGRRAHPRTIFSNSVITSSSEVEYSRMRSRTISRRTARQR